MRFPAPAVIAALLLVLPASAADWPCFRGPNHDGISGETGISTSWPKDGPPVVWSRNVGRAFSSFAIVDRRLFTCGEQDGQQVLICLNADDGEVQWKRRLEPAMTDPDENLYGTRATPTVDEGRVFILGGHAGLFCRDVRTGEQLWSRTFSNRPHWGYSGSVLIEGDLAIVSAGGSDGSLLAMDKRTGKTVWTCGDDPAGYATPQPFDFDGRRYVCGFMAQSVIIAEAATGKLALRQEWQSHSGVNVSTPIFHEGQLLVTTGYGYGSGLFRLRRDEEVLAADEVWKSTKLRCKFQTPILLGGALYASDENALKCVDFKTGRVLWRKGGIRNGSLLCADGLLLLLTETGELQIAKPSPEGFDPLATVKLFEGSKYNLFTRKQGRRCWTAPVFCNGRLYIRDHDTVVCLDLACRASEGSTAGAEPDEHR